MTNSRCIALLLLHLLYYFCSVVESLVYTPPCSYDTWCFLYLYVVFLVVFFFDCTFVACLLSFVVRGNCIMTKKSLESRKNNNKRKKKTQLYPSQYLCNGTWWTWRGRDVVTNLEEVSVLSMWHHKRLFLTILMCNSYKVSLLHQTAQLGRKHITFLSFC